MILSIQKTFAFLEVIGKYIQGDKIKRFRYKSKKDCDTYFKPRKHFHCTIKLTKALQLTKQAKQIKTSKKKLCVELKICRQFSLLFGKLKSD